MKIKIVLFIIGIFPSLLISQVAVSYFPFQSIFSISTNTEKILWVDYKLETNSFFSNMNMELSPKFNVKRKEAINYYLGPGFSFNPAYAFANLEILNGYFLDLGVRIKPWDKHRNLQLSFEISPYVNYELKSGMLRTRLGVSWNFSKVKKDEGLRN